MVVTLCSIRSFIKKKADKGSLPTCPWSFRMKLGTKIDSNMLITKIIFIFAKWTYGRSYSSKSPVKSRSRSTDFSTFRVSVTPPICPVSKNEYDFRNQHIQIYLCAKFHPETPRTGWETSLVRAILQLVEEVNAEQKESSFWTNTFRLLLLILCS